MREAVRLSSQVYVTTRDDGQCIAVSFCDAIVSLKDALRLSIFYLGVDDVNILASHVCAFLRHNEKSAKHYKTCFIWVNVTYEMNIDDVHARLQPFLGERHLPSHDFQSGMSVVSETREALRPISKL